MRGAIGSLGVHIFLCIRNEFPFDHMWKTMTTNTHDCERMNSKKNMWSPQQRCEFCAPAKRGPKWQPHFLSSVAVTLRLERDPKRSRYPSSVSGVWAQRAHYPSYAARIGAQTTSLSKLGPNGVPNGPAIQALSNIEILLCPQSVRKPKFTIESVPILGFCNVHKASENQNTL